METVQELREELVATPRADDPGVQAGCYLIELSLDWIVCRASENVHHLLGESHVTLIDEPFGNFVQAQALHDLRNLFSRLSGSTGIARAYRVRLTDNAEFFDIAFQQSGDRVILEAVPSPADGLAECLSAVGGLAAGLAGDSGQALLDLLKADPEVSGRLSGEQLDQLFNLDYHLKHVDTVFDRVFGASV